MLDDREWQERFWTAQRVGWLFMVLFLVAAIAGLTGKGGPLASATAKAADATIDYPRISRWQSDEELVVRLADSASGKVDVELSSAFGRVFTLESVKPEPASVQATARGHKFTFEVEAGAGEKQIVFDVKTGRPVMGKTINAAVGGAPGRMTVTILP